MTVEVKLTFASLDEATAFFANKQASVVQPMTGAQQAKPAKTAPAADTKQPAAPQPSPAPAPKESASEKPPAPAADTKVETPTYEKSGIGEKIANYLGDKTTEGYGDRRAKIVGLLAEFNAKSGKELKPAQFGDFMAKLNAVIGPEEALG